MLIETNSLQQLFIILFKDHQKFEKLNKFISIMYKNNLLIQSINQDASSFDLIFCKENKEIFKLNVYETLWAATNNYWSIGKKDKTVEQFAKEIIDCSNFSIKEYLYESMKAESFIINNEEKCCIVTDKDDDIVRTYIDGKLVYFLLKVFNEDKILIESHIQECGQTRTEYHQSMKMGSFILDEKIPLCAK